MINRQASILDENRIVLYKKGKQMGTGYYIVEISSSVSHVYVTAFNVEKPQSLVLTIGEKQARAILEIFEHDFEQMASWLNVEQETRLVLLNPNYNPAMRDHRS